MSQFHAALEMAWDTGKWPNGGWRNKRGNDEIKNLLASKFDRQVLMQLLGLKRIDIDDILRNCNYSDTFIKEANDLQILEGISKCYEEYRVLQL